MPTEAELNQARTQHGSAQHTAAPQEEAQKDAPAPQPRFAASQAEFAGKVVENALDEEKFSAPAAKEEKVEQPAIELPGQPELPQTPAAANDADPEDDFSDSADQPPETRRARVDQRDGDCDKFAVPCAPVSAAQEKEDARCAEALIELQPS